MSMLRQTSGGTLRHKSLCLPFAPFPDMEPDQTMKKLLDHNAVRSGEVSQENPIIISRMGKTKPHNKGNCKPSRARPNFPIPKPILSNGMIP